MLLYCFFNLLEMWSGLVLAHLHGGHGTRAFIEMSSYLNVLVKLQSVSESQGKLWASHLNDPNSCICFLSVASYMQKFGEAIDVWEPSIWDISPEIVRHITWADLFYCFSNLLGTQSTGKPLRLCCLRDVLQKDKELKVGLNIPNKLPNVGPSVSIYSSC